MTLISTTKGLNLPFTMGACEEKIVEKQTKEVMIDLSDFLLLHLRLTKKEGEKIKENELLAYDIHEEARVFKSPVSGTVKEIRRGERRHISSVVIEKDDTQTPSTPIDFNSPKEALLDKIFESGLSFFIRRRPLDSPIPHALPRSIFIKALSSAPYTPSYKYIIEGNEDLFQTGLLVLSKLAPTHLIYNKHCFARFKECTHHRAQGPHPIESLSIHILSLDPIRSAQDNIWTLDVYDVLNIGSIFSTGTFFNDRIIALAGEGFSEDERTLVKTNAGAQISELTDNTCEKICGDPLTGTLGGDYLENKHLALCGITPSEKTQVLPFAFPGFKQSTVTRAYMGGFFKKRSLSSLSYNLGGEMRPFVAKDIYQKHFPFNIYIEPLIKALMAKDYEQAIKLGFLDLVSSDFALAEYLCPSKIPLMSLFEKGRAGFIILQEK